MHLQSIIIITIFLLAPFGCSSMNMIREDSCSDRLECRRIASRNCNGSFTIIDETWGNSEADDWDHEGASPMGNVIINALELGITALSSEPWEIVYRCNK